MARNTVLNLLFASLFCWLTVNATKEASCSFDIWKEALNLYEECAEREKLIMEIYHTEAGTKIDSLCKDAETQMNDCRKKIEDHLKDCKDPTKDALIEEYVSMSVGYLNHPCDTKHKKLEGKQSTCSLEELRKCLEEIKNCYYTHSKLSLDKPLSMEEIEQECTEHYNEISECRDIEEQCLKKCWNYDQKLLIRAFEDMDWHSQQELCTRKGKVLYEFFQQNGSQCFEGVMDKAIEKDCSWEKVWKDLTPYNAPEKCVEVMLKMDCSNAPIHFLPECKNVNTRLVLVFVHTHFWDPVCFRPLGRQQLDEHDFGFRSLDDLTNDTYQVTISLINWFFQSIFLTFIFSNRNFL